MNTEEEAIGFLDDVTDTYVMGWARLVHSNAPLTVRLVINDEEVAQTLANVHRPDIQNAGVHPTGYCGYYFDLRKENITLRENCVVQIDVGNGDAGLKNTPWFFYADDYIEEIRQEIKNIKFKKNDKKVIIVGLAKSGTSILTYRISSALEGATLNFETYNTQFLNHIEFHRKIQQEKIVVSKALYYRITRYMPLVSAYYNKKIFIVRDPRDLLLSNFFYSWHKDSNRPKEKFEQALDLILKKERTPTLISMNSLFETRPEVKQQVLNNVKEICDVLGTLDDSWLILRYEDFIQDNVEKLNDYLGFSVKLTTSVPDRLKKVERSKSFDNWRKWFSAEDVSLFRPELENYLHRLGYDADDWKLDNPARLPAADGSAYIKRIYGYTWKQAGVKKLKDVLSFVKIGS